MASFREAVDQFVAREKWATGELEWKPGRDQEGVSGYWLIATAEGITKHRLHVVAYPHKHYPAFTVMAEFKWQGREIPFIRLNIDADFNTHINHPPRPSGIDELQVTGNRIYFWEFNRKAFNIAMKGLPYCVSFRPQGISLPSAIRAVAGEARIDLSQVDLPESPARITLL